MRKRQMFKFNRQFRSSSLLLWISGKFLPFSRMLFCVFLIATCITISHCVRKNPAEADLDTHNTGILTGYVRDAEGPIKGAIVRVQATEKYVTTNDSGQFTLTGLQTTDSVKITAWAKGYYISGGKSYWPDSNELVLELYAHHTTDNPNYQWISAYSSEGSASNCQNCHAEPGIPDSNMPFDEWQQDAHGQSAKNIRFLTMYLGTDINGNQSPNTSFGYNRDYGTFPLPPNLDEPYYGPGYKLDFPSTSGNCGACHTPAAAINTPYSVNPSELTGVHTEGVACDFCHKVWDVKLNPATGLPYDNMPGVLSFEMRRPPEGHQFFSGPLDDVAPGEDTFTPVQKESRYCAPCHSAKFWDVEIYNSFGEWLESSYSDPQSGQTCQDCHMPSGLTDHFAKLDQGGLKRDSKNIVSHRMLGITDLNFMQNAVTVTSSAERQDSEIVVNIEIYNDRTGHHIPTDSPLRHMILLVQAFDEQGDPLIQTDGSILPDWCGIGDPDMGYYAGLPGKAYAKILEELWTGVTPTGAYWNKTRLASDNRIPALGRDQSTFSFSAQTNEKVTIDIQLIFRRAYIQLMDWKSWDSPDILMAEQWHTVQ